MNERHMQERARAGYNRVPVVREVLADLDTPLSTYLKLAAGPYSYLFESVVGGEKWGRYSIIGLPCARRIEVHGHTVVEFDGERVVRSVESVDPLQFIEDYQRQFRVPTVPGLPRFSGGLVGYFGYDTVRYIEPRLAACRKPDELHTPDILLLHSEEVVVFDNLRGKLYLITHVDPQLPDAWARGQRRLDELARRLQAPFQHVEQTSHHTLIEADFISGFTQPGFEGAVRKAKEYITAGDIMQVVLSQRLSAPFHGDALDVYRALRSLNPSPYMYFLNCGAFQVAGSSPEILVRLEGDNVTVRPIAGTRPRGDTEQRDHELEQELLADPKEIAEHVMLIDLGRNDVGRVAETGSVQVTEQMIVERYSHVMHIVSNVIGRKRPEVSAMDVLRATFPAGTVSGAAKVRAMEVIDELEPVKRGIYAGAVGYLGWNGNLDTAIAIRTAVIQDNMLYMQSGAGIVYDSVPRSEWEETMAKGRAVFRAAAWAARGLKDDVHQ
ncbi:MAG: anthranilate synthase component I [Pseudomonadota bacterium]